MDDAGDDVGGVVWMTYAELGKARGISTASATRLAFRRKWRRHPGNDGAARVAVPSHEARHQREAIPDNTPDAAPDTHDAPLLIEQDAMDVVREALAVVREQLERERSRADQAEARANAAGAEAARERQAREAERSRAEAAERARDAAEAERKQALARAEKAEAAAAKWAAADKARRSAGLWARVRAAVRGE